MDPELVVDQDLKQRLMDGGMDDLLATHFAHLFIRDPIVIFAEDLKELDLNKTDHFENLNQQTGNTCASSPTARQRHRLARRIPPHGNPNHRL